MRTLAQRSNSFFQAERRFRLIGARSALAAFFAHILHQHLADDALDLFASVWRYELAAAVALLVALRRS